MSPLVKLALPTPLWSTLLWLSLCWAGAAATATTAPTAAPPTDLVAVSKPPVPLLPTDPPQGRLFGAPASLAFSETVFDTRGGPLSLEYLIFDGAGNGYLTFDDGPDETAPGGVLGIKGLKGRLGGAFDPARDRLLAGPESGLLEPKDLTLADAQTRLIVADFAAARVSVFSALPNASATPQFVTPDLGVSVSGESRRPWGLAYHEARDRLFVGATDGTLLVYDDYLTGEGRGGPDRSVTPTLAGAVVSHNLHGLVYLAEHDTVVVTDVGAATTAAEAGFEGDGALLVIAGASRADGPTPVQARLHGPAALLGNPVAVRHRDGSFFVAEQALDLLLRFDGVLGLEGDVVIAPDAAVSVVKPVSVVLLPNAR